ncbi:MAG: type II CAAX endopeptidase family protein [Cyanobacteria bacterium P01_H01_bin.26]
MNCLAHYRQVARGRASWRVVVFFAVLLVLWSPLALAIYLVGNLFGRPQLAETVVLLALYGCFTANAWIWGHWVKGWQRPFEAYGLLLCRRFWSDLLIALVFGFGLVWVLFGVEVLLGWARFYPTSLGFITLEGFGVGIGIGLAEELLFRGWLLAELQTSLPRAKAIMWSSIIFALAHFIKPLPEVLRTSPQFLGLLLLGLILGSSRYISRLQRPFSSLGLPLGLHAGLVWGYYIVDVGDLVLPSGRVPEWVTGIHGNPLSGALGIAILGCLSAYSWLRLRSE